MAEIQQITFKDIMEVIHHKVVREFTGIPVVLLHKETYEKLKKDSDDNSTNKAMV